MSIRFCRKWRKRAKERKREWREEESKWKKENQLRKKKVRRGQFWVAMNNRKWYYNLFKLFETNIPTFKASTFQISLKAFGYSKCKKYALSNFFTFARLIFFLMVWKFQTLIGIFCLKSCMRFAKRDLTTLNFTLFLNKQCWT